MMKKLKHSEEPIDYEVGLVSGSLARPGPGSGSLSALFKTSAPSSALFQPAPEIVKSVAPVEKPKETPKVKVQTQKKVQVKETPGETKVQTREQGLQAADDVDQASVRPRKRKLPPGGEEDADFWINRRQRLRENKQRDCESQSRTVFVGNLPLSSTKKTLRLLFKDKGPIETIRFRSLVREDPSMPRKVAAIMRKAHPQKQSINAYVVFKEEQSVASALDRNGLELEPDLFIRVDRVSASDSHDHKRSVFVGNLPFDLKEAPLRRHFSDCGSVEAVRLIRDPQTGLGKGFGYLLFQSADSVQLALELNGSKLEGRAIRVKRSVHNDKLKKTNQKSPGSKPQPGKNARRRERNLKQSFKHGKSGSKSGFRPGTKPGQFRGEMADPTKKKKKFIKKKTKGKKAEQKK